MFDFTEYIGNFWVFDFSNTWWDVKMIKFTEYIDFFLLFVFSTSCWEVTLIDFTGYIDFFRLFDFSTLEGGGGGRNWPGGKSMVRVLISRKNQACKNEGVDVTFPNVFCKKYRWHRNWLFQCSTRNKYWHNNIIGFVHPIEERSFNPENRRLALSNNLEI